MIEYLVEVFYVVTLAALAAYALHALVLMVLYLRHRHDEPTPPPDLVDDRLPSVTVQVPLRNERYVAAQMLQAVGALDWPWDRLQIQVLDDSDDETTAIVMAEAACLQERGCNVEVLHRDGPAGYKAGALAEATARASGKFIAIFDADFCPAPDFLRRTVPYLVADSALGMVQARWTHLNAAESWLTRVQALALDAHFSVDHIARAGAGLLSNFNGAAGVWRKQAIVESGGWQCDTLTEDLDLSYRAQLAGWRLCYLPNVTAPAQLPSLLSAFKAQQVRWTKGSSQCLRKLIGPILRSRRLNFAQKVMAVLHLSGYANQPFILLMILLTTPMVLTNPVFADFTLWLGALSVVPPLLFVLGQAHFYRDWPRRVLVYPMLMLLWVGLAYSITLAFFEGLLVWGGSFVRTPKFRTGSGGAVARRDGYHPPLSATWIGELALWLYVCVAIGLAFRLEHQHLLPLVIVYALGELLVLATTMVQELAARRTAQKADDRSMRDRSRHPARGALSQGGNDGDVT